MITVVPKGASGILKAAFPQPRLGGRLISTINGWLKSNGTEWTCSRLKNVWAAAKQLKAGNTQTAISIYRENSISYCKGSLLVKGPFKLAMFWFVYGSRPSVVRRGALVLRIYTSLKSRKLTSSQFLKSEGSITEPGPRNWGAVGSNLYRMVPKLLSRNKIESLGRPDLSALRPFSMYHREGSWIPSSLRHFPYGNMLSSMVSSAYLPDYLQKINPCKGLWSSVVESGADTEVPGHISFIQEGGCKARVVAVPNFWIQWLFEPLHRALNFVIQRYPASAVHDQNKGASFLLKNLGRPLWCFDLQSASDRIPLRLQQLILSNIGLGDWVPAFDQVTQNWRVKVPSGIESGTLWDTGNGFQEGNWDYGYGQPMGLYGSFPLFHFAHIILLGVLSRGLSERSQSTFMVLGDDVIISDERLADQYLHALETLGIPISPQKSIASSSFGEFAGFIAYESGRNKEVFRPYKFASSGLASPLNLLYSLGKRAKGLGKYFQIREGLLASTLIERYPDLSPMFGDREPEGRRPAGVDTHFLGAVLNRILTINDYHLAESFMDSWLNERHFLTAGKECLNSDGYATHELNVFGISIPDRQQDKSRLLHVNRQLMSDPLMRSAVESLDTFPGPSSAH